MNDGGRQKLYYYLTGASRYRDYDYNAMNDDDNIKGKGLKDSFSGKVSTFH